MIIAKTIGGAIVGRKYKMPIRYEHWEDLEKKIATPPEGLNQVGVLTVSVYALWEKMSYPLYCISSELLEQFKENDISKTILGGIDNLPLNFAIALPKGCLFDSEGESVDSIVVTDAFRLTERADFDYVVCTITKFGCWASCGKLSSFGKTENKSQDFYDELESIALQSAFAIAYEPSLISESTEREFASGSGFAKPKDDSRCHFSRPRWIGKSYVRTKALPRGGTHASPIDHWRRGHWRNQACGVGRTDRKLVYVRPTFIGK